MMMETGFIWLKIETSEGCLGTCYEPSGYIKGMEFLEWLSEYQLFKDSIELISCSLL
jgi:hypothetical protein